MKTQVQWTVAEWRTLGSRCQTLRNRVGDVGQTIQGAKGLTAPLVDAWLQVENRFISAMIGMEDRFESECPAGAWWNMLHGPSGAGCPPPTIPRRTVPILTRDEWAALGVEVNEIRAELSALIGEASQAFDRSHRVMQRMKLAARALSRASFKLDGLRCKQHPAWGDFAEASCGLDEPNKPGGYAS